MFKNKNLYKYEFYVPTLLLNIHLIECTQKTNLLSADIHIKCQKTQFNIKIIVAASFNIQYAGIGIADSIKGNNFLGNRHVAARWSVLSRKLTDITAFSRQCDVLCSVGRCEHYLNSSYRLVCPRLYGKMNVQISR